jgi:hypothetical protein
MYGQNIWMNAGKSNKEGNKGYFISVHIQSSEGHHHHLYYHGNLKPVKVHEVHTL